MLRVRTLTNCFWQRSKSSSEIFKTWGESILSLARETTSTIVGRGEDPCSGVAEGMTLVIEERSEWKTLVVHAVRLRRKGVSRAEPIWDVAGSSVGNTFHEPAGSELDT